MAGWLDGWMGPNHWGLILRPASSTNGGGAGPTPVQTNIHMFEQLSPTRIVMHSFWATVCCPGASRDARISHNTD